MARAIGRRCMLQKKSYTEMHGIKCTAFGCILTSGLRVRKEGTQGILGVETHHACVMRGGGEAGDGGVGEARAAGGVCPQRGVDRGGAPQAQQVHPFLRQLSQHVVHSTAPHAR